MTKFELLAVAEQLGFPKAVVHEQASIYRGDIEFRWVLYTAPGTPTESVKLGVSRVLSSESIVASRGAVEGFERMKALVELCEALKARFL